MKIPTKRTNRYHHSPLRYPGGKSFLFPLFDRLLGETDMTDVVYIEPFAGGAGAALALLLRDKVSSIVINDFDRAIYSFWKSAVVESERFIDTIRSTPVTVPQWKKQKAIYQNHRSKRFELGFATFFLNRTNRSGFLAGGPIGGMEQKGEWKLTARYNKSGLVARIEKLQAFRDRIKITNKDGVELLDDYLDNKNALMYLDPPYYDKGATLYMNHYRESDHKLLAKKLNANASANWILTYDNNPVIQTLYRKRRRQIFSLNYNAYEPRVGSELFIMSDAM